MHRVEIYHPACHQGYRDGHNGSPKMEKIQGKVKQTKAQPPAAPRTFFSLLFLVYFWAVILAIRT